MFTFGDSTADVGTYNRLLLSQARDFPHNGVNFPISIPTGRFSDGFNNADFLAKLSGSEEAHSFLLLLALKSHFMHHLCKRVNFASGGAGQDATETMLSKSLFFINIGRNDIIGYFKSNSIMPKDEFISILISAHSIYIGVLLY
ncbi:GDSL esterase/lipase At5g55050-like [Primulina huaijiensis]|uniref:GDSL esterase/lipase At5g55050-like n=1 Tax=Primulina huaijiensis TaxID=1492673 RepID=UPI003CC71056